MGDIKTYNIGNIETAQFFYQSLDYQALMERIAEKQEMVQYLQETGKIERALKASAELEELEQQKEQFKQNVFRLYETFTKIEINSDRLKQAKAHFDRGEFREADAILNAADMARDLDQLIERDQQLDREKAEIEQYRTQLANEYLIKARLWTTFYSQPDRFEQSCTYFEKALRAARTPETVFEYAVLLHEHNCFNQAKLLYKEALQTYRDLMQDNSRTFLPNVAMAFNNLAILQQDQNDLSAAEHNYHRALRAYRKLAQGNPHTFLPCVATALNNLATLRSDQNDLSKAERNYREALQIRRGLAQDKPCTSVANTLNNLAILQKAQNNWHMAEDNYQEALQIYQKLAQDKPCNFVANTLNSLANLQKAQNNWHMAEDNYHKALQIYRELAQDNPRTHLPDVAMTLINLSILYLRDIPDKEQSIALATEVLEIAQQFPQGSVVQSYAKTSIQVLQKSGIDANL